MPKVFTCVIMLLFCVSSTYSAEKTNKPKVQRLDSLIAVFDIDVVKPVEKNICRPLTDSIKSVIHKSGKYEVMERGEMSKILKEQAFQMTGCVAKECAIEAGQMLGVGKVVIGSVSQVGKTYLLSLSLVNVASGKVEQVEDQECKCEVDDLIKLSKCFASVGNGLCSRLS